MIRTIKIERSDENCNNFSYKGKMISHIVIDVRKFFGLKSGRTYRIAITEVSKKGFKFKASPFSPWYYNIYRSDIKGDRLIQGLLCKTVFHKIFFKPKRNKRYSIIVKEVI